MKRKPIVDKKDFLISDLPSNRKELFFDILKNQWRNLFLIAMIILLLSLPIIILRYYNLTIITNMVSNANIENIRNNIFNSYISYNAVNSLLIIVVGVLSGGLLRVYKKICFNEGYFLGADFVKGIKENLKDTLALFFLYAALSFILEVLCVNYLLDNNYLYYFFKVINYFVLLPILLVSLNVSALYSDKIFVKIKTGYKLYIKYFFKIAITVFVLILPLGLLMIGTSYVQLFLPIAYVLIYLPIVYVIFVLVMNSIFDKEINKNNFPELVNKGLYKPNN